jgi:RNA polymerase sigma-70 factor (ECF subfamily)
MLSDTELVAEIRSGNMSAFRALYYRHIDSVFALVSRLLGNRRGEAEDVAQEVFIQVHRSIGRFEGVASFSTWLHRVTVNVCYSHLRRSVLRTESVDAEGAHEPATADNREAHVDARRQIRRMFELLEELTLANRVVFTLYEFQGMTLSQIAEVLDIPLHTAASRLRRSRESLMRCLAKKQTLVEGGR